MNKLDFTNKGFGRTTKAFSRTTKGFSRITNGFGCRLFFNYFYFQKQKLNITCSVPYSLHCLCLSPLILY